MTGRLFLSVSLILILVALCSADESPPAPVTLGDFGLQFTPPPTDFWERTQHSTDRIVAFTTLKHDAIVAFELLPDDMVIDRPVTAAILKQLRGEHLKNKTKMFLDPVAESDERFALKVHERFEVGRDDKKKVSDQLHMYLYVGKHLLMATVNSVAGDPESVDAAHRQAEDALLSATAPGVKPRKFIPRPTTRPSTKPATRAVAKPKIATP